MPASLCLVAYCPQEHLNVIALITEPKLVALSGSKVWRLVCRTCLQALQIPECDLRKEYVPNADLDRIYDRQTLPTLP